jgi:hypothetical protein
VGWVQRIVFGVVEVSRVQVTNAVGLPPAVRSAICCAFANMNIPISRVSAAAWVLPSVAKTRLPAVSNVKRVAESSEAVKSLPGANAPISLLYTSMTFPNELPVPVTPMENAEDGHGLGIALEIMEGTMTNDEAADVELENVEVFASELEVEELVALLVVVGLIIEELGVEEKTEDVDEEERAVVLAVEGLTTEELVDDAEDDGTEELAGGELAALLILDELVIIEELADEMGGKTTEDLDKDDNATEDVRVRVVDGVNDFTKEDDEVPPVHFPKPGWHLFLTAQ